MHGGLGKLEIQDPKRGAILRCARAAFVAQGYAGAKIEPIARDAGVSTATLYALFAGKSELFAAVIDDVRLDFKRQMHCVQCIEGDVRQQLTSFAQCYAEFLGDPFVRSVLRLVLVERPRFQPVATRFFERGRKVIGSSLISILTKHAGSGALKPLERPSWAAGQLMGMIEHPLFFVPLVTGGEVQPQRAPAKIAADAVETFLSRYAA